MSEVGDEFPVLVGQVPLELVDWVVDCKGLKLIGNTEHGGRKNQRMTIGHRESLLATDWKPAIEKRNATAQSNVEC